MMYAFATIRSIARGDTQLYTRGWGFWPIRPFTRRKITCREVKDAHLVYTQDERVARGQENTFINRKIRLQDLARFIDSNVSLLKDAHIPDISLEKGDELNIKCQIEKAKKFKNVELREFDDQFADSRLVYGIVINQ